MDLCLWSRRSLSRQRVIKVHFVPDHLLEQQLPSDSEDSIQKGNKHSYSAPKMGVYFYSLFSYNAETQPY